MTEAVIERFEDRVVNRCGQSSHVEDATEGGAAAVDVALTAVLSAVAVHGCDAGESSGFVVTQGAEFRHESDDGECGDAADAADLLEALGLGREVGLGGDVGIDQGIEGGELLLEVTLARVGELEECGKARVFAAVDLIGDERDEVLARADEFGELGLARGRSGIRARLEAAAVVADDRGIEIVGFGKVAAGTRKVADLTGVDGTDGNTGRMQREHQCAFVAAGRLTDDVDGVEALEFGDEGGVSRGRCWRWTGGGQETGLPG